MAALIVENAGKTFSQGKEKIIALQNVNLQIEEGEIFGLLGPNGAGKTTIISGICGLLELDEGKITVFGKDALHEKETVSKGLSLITGFAGLLQGLSVQDLLNYYSLLYTVPDRKTAIEKALEKTGLKEKRLQIAETLSSGYRQRFYIAKALLSDPNLILMDEPTVGLDVKSAMQIRNLIKELKQQGKTILLTTHYMYEAEQLCDHIALINEGRIVASGTLAELKQKTGNQNANLEQVFLALTSEPWEEEHDA